MCVLECARLGVARSGSLGCRAAVVHGYYYIYMSCDIAQRESETCLGVTAQSPCEYPSQIIGRPSSALLSIFSAFYYFYFVFSLSSSFSFASLALARSAVLAPVGGRLALSAARLWEIALLAVVEAPSDVRRAGARGANFSVQL